MSSRIPAAGTGGRAAARRPPAAGPGPRVAVALGPVAGIGSRYRVLAPARVLRMWALLNQASQEISGHDPPPEAVGRLHGLFVAVTRELRRSFSPALTGELDQLIGRFGDDADAAQVRIEYASLLGWLGGLVISMLSELDTAAWTLNLASAASAAAAPPPGTTVRPDAGREGSPPPADRPRAVPGAGPSVPPRLPGSLGPSPYL